MGIYLSWNILVYPIGNNDLDILSHMWYMKVWIINSIHVYRMVCINHVIPRR